MSRIGPYPRGYYPVRDAVVVAVLVALVWATYEVFKYLVCGSGQ